EVAAAEKRAAEAYRFRHGRPHPSLEEHLDYGLPQEEEVRSLLQELGVSHAVFDNAPLDAWLPMMMLSENLFERKALAQCYYRLNQILLMADHPSESIPYRKVYVVAKGDAKIEDRESKIEDRLIPKSSCPDSPSSIFDSQSSLLDLQSSASPCPLATVQRFVATA